MSAAKRILFVVFFTLPVIGIGAEPTTMKELAEIINGRINKLLEKNIYNKELKSLMEIQHEVNFIADPNSEKFPTKIITDPNIKKKAVEKLIQKIDGDIQKLLIEKGAYVKDLKAGKNVKLALTETEYRIFSAQKFKEFILNNQKLFEHKGSRLWQYEITVDDFAKKLAEKNITIDHLWDEHYARMRINRGGTSLNNLIKTNQASRRPPQLPGERRAVRTPRVSYPSFPDAIVQVKKPSFFSKIFSFGSREIPAGAGRVVSGVGGVVAGGISIAHDITDSCIRLFKTLEDLNKRITLLLKTVNEKPQEIEEGTLDNLTRRQVIIQGVFNGIPLPEERYSFMSRDEIVSELRATQETYDQLYANHGVQKCLGFK